MKTTLILSIVFSLIALPALGALTDADLNQIRLIVQEESRPIKADIVALKTDGAVVTSEVANLKQTVNDGFGNVQKNFDRLHNIIIACIGIPLAMIAIGATVWGILAHRRSRKDQRLETQIQVLTEKTEKQIQTLTQEIETLKSQQIVRP